MAERMLPDKRSTQILDAAVVLAKRKGFQKLTRDTVAVAAKVSTGLVSTYYDMPALRDEVMKVAVRDKILAIVAQGIAAGHKVAMRAPVEVRQAAMQSLVA